MSGKSYGTPNPLPLPKIRVQDALPFTVTGVDFTGALYVKEKSVSESKAYVCLFTCACTRIVYLKSGSEPVRRIFPQRIPKGFLAGNRYQQQ